MLVARLDPMRMHRVAPDGSMWSCQGCSLGLAVAMTLWYFVVLRLLPAPAAPAERARLGVRVHHQACHIVAGAVVLPTAFAWHLWGLQLAASILTPTLVRNRKRGSGVGVAGSWSMFAAWLALDATLKLACLGLVRMLGLARIADLRRTGRVPPERAKRYDANLLKVCEFLLAWLAYAVIQSVHKPVICTDCFPSDTPYALKSLAVWAPVPVTAAIALACLLVVLARVAAATRADARESSLAPTAQLGRRWRAHCWQIMVGSLGIPLGWAVKDCYTASLTAGYNVAEGDASTVPPSINVVVAGALVVSVLVGAGYSLACGDCRRERQHSSQQDRAKVRPEC